MKQGKYFRTEENKKRLSEARKRFFLNGGIHPMKGKKHSNETKEKIASKQRGVPMTEEQRRHLSKVVARGRNHRNWKGGVTSTNRIIRQSLDYKLWREAVFKRDDFTCIWCGKRGGDLNADHIKPFAFFPELRFAIDNGRTLCVPCHRTTFKDIWKN